MSIEYGFSAKSKMNFKISFSMSFSNTYLVYFRDQNIKIELISLSAKSENRNWNDLHTVKYNSITYQLY